jgi:hypothetical protein
MYANILSKYKAKLNYWQIHCLKLIRTTSLSALSIPRPRLQEQCGYHEPGVGFLTNSVKLAAKQISCFAILQSDFAVSGEVTKETSFTKYENREKLKN